MSFWTFEWQGVVVVYFFHPEKVLASLRLKAVFVDSLEKLRSGSEQLSRSVPESFKGFPGVGCGVWVGGVGGECGWGGGWGGKKCRKGRFSGVGGRWLPVLFFISQFNTCTTLSVFKRLILGA